MNPLKALRGKCSFCAEGGEDLSPQSSLGTFITSKVPPKAFCPEIFENSVKMVYFTETGLRFIIYVTLLWSTLLPPHHSKICQVLLS